MLWLVLTLSLGASVAGVVGGLFYVQSAHVRRLRLLMLTLLGRVSQGMIPTQRLDQGIRIGPLPLHHINLHLTALLTSADEGFTLCIEAPLEREHLDWLALDAQGRPLLPTSITSLHIASDTWRAPLMRQLIALSDEPPERLQALTQGILPAASGQLLELELERDKLKLTARFLWDAMRPEDFEPLALGALHALVTMSAQLATGLAASLPARPWDLWAAIFSRSWDDPHAQYLALKILLDQCPQLEQTQALWAKAKAKSFGPVILLCCPSAELSPMLESLSTARLLQLLAEVHQLHSGLSQVGRGLPAIPQKTITTLATLTRERLIGVSNRDEPLLIAPKHASPVVSLWLEDPTRHMACAKLILSCWPEWDAQTRAHTITQLAAHPGPHWSPILALALEGFHAPAHAQLLLSWVRAQSAYVHDHWRLKAMPDFLALSMPHLADSDAPFFTSELVRHGPAPLVGALTRALNQPHWTSPRSRQLAARALERLRERHQSAALQGILTLDTVEQPAQGQLTLTQSASAGDLSITPQESPSD